MRTALTKVRVELVHELRLPRDVPQGSYAPMVPHIEGFGHYTEQGFRFLNLDVGQHNLTIPFANIRGVFDLPLAMESTVP